MNDTTAFLFGAKRSVFFLIRNFKKSFALLLVVALLLSSYPLSIVSASGQTTAAPALADGEYLIGYRYLENNLPNTSAANGYLQTGSSGKLIVAGGKTTFEQEVTQKNYNRFQYLGYRKAGGNKAVITKESVSKDGYEPVSASPANNGTDHVIITIEIEDIRTNQDVLMHVYIKDDPDFDAGFVYDNWYNVQLELDKSTLPLLPVEEDDNGGETEQPITLETLDELITVSRSVYQSANEGTEIGDYPTGAKQEFYNSIVLAEALRAGSSSAPALIKAVYENLAEALNKFRALIISADKAALRALIAETEAFVAQMNELGAAEGKLGHTFAPITPGEYALNSKPNLEAFLNKARIVALDEKSVQLAVDNAWADLNSNYISYANAVYIAWESAPIYVLDSLDPTTTQSNYASEIGTTVTYITNNSLPRVSANITLLKGELEISEVVQSTALRTGLMTTTGLDFAVDSNKALPVTKISDESHKVYQVIIRHLSANLPGNTTWIGLSYISYKVGDQTRQVYISYNSELLEALKLSAGTAEKLLNEANPIDGSEQAYSTAEQSLQEKIDSALQAASNLAATRPQIAAAQKALDTAVKEFKLHAAYPIYFTAVHADKEEFSIMDNYFVKPAVISAAGEGNYASFTVTDSSIIKSLQIYTNGQFVESEIVSEDSNADTRVVKFKVDDLAALVEAKVHIVTAYGGQTYDRIDTIRLNFNNVNNKALSDEIALAGAVLTAAQTGTKQGEYSAETKAAFQSVITAAAKAAASVTGTQAETDAALLALVQAVEVFKDNAVKGIADGEYAIGFRILKYGTNDNSVMQEYVDPTAILKVAGEEKTVHMTLNQHKGITALKFNGQDVKVESIDAAANKRVVSFPISLLTAIQDGWVKVDMTDINYHHEYDIQLKLDVSSLISVPVDVSALSALVKSAQQAHDGAVEGEKDGNYKSGAKALLAAAIAEASASEDASLSQAQIDAAAAKLNVALTAFHAAKVSSSVITNPDQGLANGEYSIGVRILKIGTEQTSVMQDYIYSPAKLIVSGSSKTIHLTLKQDKEITALKFNGANVSVVSRNAEQNTRVVSFPVADLSKVTEGWVKIDWPAMDYFHEYSIQFKFDEASIRPYSSSDDPALLPELEEEEEKEELNEPVVTSFKDVQGHWAQSTIEKAIALGIAKGYEDGSFRPNAVINRAEFAVLIGRTLKLQSSTATIKFNDNTDIPNWAQEYVTRAVAAGLVGGYEDQTFRASNEITRAELAVIIARAAKLETKEDAVLSFDDADQFPSWARKEAAAAIEAGLIQGKGKNKFDPNASATRAEALTLILRLLESK